MVTAKSLQGTNIWRYRSLSVLVIFFLNFDFKRTAWILGSNEDSVMQIRDAMSHHNRDHDQY
jgi:hypothetical protein